MSTGEYGEDGEEVEELLRALSVDYFCRRNICLTDDKPENACCYFVVLIK